MDTKYKFNDVTYCHGDLVLHQIVATCNFSDVKEGDTGGYIEHEGNLRHDGDCWVYDTAIVYGNATVRRDAHVGGNATVYGNALVSGKAIVRDNAIISDNSVVHDNSLIGGNANIYDNIRVYRNAIVTQPIISIISTNYPICITDNHIDIGYQQHTIKQWMSFTSAQVIALNSEAIANQWFKYKDFIKLLIADRDGDKSGS